MKKFVKVILVCVLVLILGLMLAACNNDGSSLDNENGETDIEATYYTVKFVTNGDVELEKNEFVYASNEKIIKPEFTPVKKGYKFEYWSTDGGTTKFDFDNFSFEDSNIEGVFTITAYYTNMTYTHIKDTTTKLVRNEVEGVVTYSQLANAYDSEKYPQDGISAISSTYGQKNTLSVPQNTNNDKFCFWYYMDKGQPVQFTEYLHDEVSTVSMLESYSKTESLTLYAMWESNLKEIAPIKVNYVKYSKGTSGWENNTLLTVNHLSYDNIFQTEVESLSVAGYSIKDFSYDSVKAGKMEKFEFAEIESEKVVPGTFLHTILVDSEIFVDYFTPAEINIQTNWTKEISIASVSDYTTKLYDVMQGEDEDEKKELQKARIIFSAGAMDFGGQAFGPLFDKDHVFEGTICTIEDGSKVIIQNVVLEGKDSISLFGYVDGKIYDVSVNTVSFNILPIEDTTYANNIIIGVIATHNAGFITSADVELDTIVIKKDGCVLTNGILENGYSNIVFGGIVGINAGEKYDDELGKVYGSTENGKLSVCSIDINSITIYAENVTFGGIIGESGSISRLVDIKAVVAATIVSATDGNVINGNPSVKFGGIAGANGGSITSASVIVNTSSSTQILGDVYVGGVTGTNAGDLQRIDAEGTITLIVGGTSQSVGGLIGINEGSIYNCLSKVSISLTASKDASVLNVGGFVGSNVSDKTDATSSMVAGIGAINNSYTTGSITVDCGTLQNIALYVGGISGTNAYKKIASCFVLNDITITNEGEHSNVDYFFGSLLRDGKATSLYRATLSEKPIMINGEPLTPSGEYPEWAIETDMANFSDSVWFFGDASTDPHLNWDKTVWHFDGGELKLL